MDVEEEDVVVVDADADGDAIKHGGESCAAVIGSSLIGLGEHDDVIVVGRQERRARRDLTNGVDVGSQQRDVAVEAAHSFPDDRVASA